MVGKRSITPHEVFWSQTKQGPVIKSTSGGRVVATLKLFVDDAAYKTDRKRDVHFFPAAWPAERHAVHVIVESRRQSRSKRRFWNVGFRQQVRPLIWIDQHGPVE